jgi:2-methylcitrate dehydratase
VGLGLTQKGWCAQSELQLVAILRRARVGRIRYWKAYAAADASRKVIFAVRLAKNGMTGPSNVFEGRYAFFKVMSRKEVRSPKLGEPLGIRRTF